MIRQERARERFALVIGLAAQQNRESLESAGSQRRSSTCFTNLLEGRMAISVVVQDEGLHFYARTPGFSWT